MKRTTDWLWKTKLTEREVLERLSLEDYPREWLICPHGESSEAVEGDRFVADPEMFSRSREQPLPEEHLSEEPGTSSSSRLCLDCGAPMNEIKLIDKAEGLRHHPVEYTAVDSARGFLSGRYQPSGLIQAYLCQSCGAVRLYAQPHE